MSQDSSQVNEEKLNEFMGQMIADLGGAFAIPLVRMGDKLGLYKALHERGPMTPAQLARRRPDVVRGPGLAAAQTRYGLRCADLGRYRYRRRKASNRAASLIL